MENQENSNNINPSVNLQNQNSNSNLEMRDRIKEYNSNINRYNNSQKSNPNVISNSSNNNLDKSKGSNQQSSRNDANNAEAVKTAADIASNSGHPVASAIGKGIKAADKISGGKASEKFGKAISGANKLTSAGRFGQFVTNKAIESGAINKINKSRSIQGDSTSEGIMRAKNKQGLFKPPMSTGSDLGGAKNQKQQMEDSYDDGKENFKISYKAVKTMAILAIPVFLLMIFMVLLVSGSQVFLHANILGHSDEASDDAAVEKMKESTLNEQIEDEKLSEEQEKEDKENEVSYANDIYINDNEEFEKYEFVDEKYRYNQEASLEDLEDYYPEIKNYTNGDYDQNDVYKFYLKLHYIYKHYYEDEKVKLDLALIMSVLRLQSDDMHVVFKANTSEYTKEDIELGKDNPDFAWDKDWSSYKPTRDNSAHDIEVLAQGMAKEGSSSNGSSNRTVSKTGKEAIDKMNEIALQQADEVHAGGQKYWSWYGFSYRDEWCAMFVSWLFNQINGLDKYIKSSAVAGGIVRDSTNAGYGTWYEDECTDSSTVPQAGDVIVFDPWVGGTYLPYPKHGNDKYYSSHVGYVYKVDDTYVYTVEGNSSDSVRTREYNRKTHCGTAGIQGINGYFRPNY